MATLCCFIVDKLLLSISIHFPGHRSVDRVIGEFYSAGDLLSSKVPARPVTLVTLSWLGQSDQRYACVRCIRYPYRSFRSAMRRSTSTMPEIHCLPLLFFRVHYPPGCPVVRVPMSSDHSSARTIGRLSTTLNSSRVRVCNRKSIWVDARSLLVHHAN